MTEETWSPPSTPNRLQICLLNPLKNRPDPSCSIFHLSTPQIPTCDLDKSLVIELNVLVTCSLTWTGWWPVHWLEHVDHSLGQVKAQAFKYYASQWPGHVQWPGHIQCFIGPRSMAWPLTSKVGGLAIDFKGEWHGYWLQRWMAWPLTSKVNGMAIDFKGEWPGHWLQRWMAWLLTSKVNGMAIDFKGEWHGHWLQRWMAWPLTSKVNGMTIDFKGEWHDHWLQRWMAWKLTSKVNGMEIDFIGQWTGHWLLRSMTKLYN
jgi:hypothetical protein